MYRRTLLRLGLYGSLMQCLPRLAWAVNPNKAPVLVLVELNGGNDSLNTVVPLKQVDVYQKLRPELGLQAAERLVLDEHFALHNALQPLLPIWQAGQLALVHGVGYPAPNHSHFRGIEIWDTASASDEYINSGWLAGPVSSLSSAPVDAIVLGRNAASVMGDATRYLRLDSLAKFVANAGQVNAVDNKAANPALDFIVSQQNALFDGAELLIPKIKQSPPLNTSFPESAFGKSMADAAKLIKLDLGIPVIKVELGSFDTHRDQRLTHERLLKDLADGLAALYSELQTAGLWDRVAIMTYSEFGRRAAQNGSGGTDHGTAATHFVMGGTVSGGHVGDHPDLTELVDQDMQFTTDFRRLYQTILSDFWGRPELKIQGGSWASLPIFK